MGSSAAWHGPQLLERLPGAGAPALTLEKLPESGVHVDVPHRTVGVWLTNPVPGLFRWLPRLWPGWRIERWEDRYEEHLLRCGQRVTAPELDIASGVINARDMLRKRVFQSYEDSPGGQLEKLAALLGAEEPEEDTPWIFAAGERPRPAEWARFERACAQVVEQLAA